MQNKKNSLVKVIGGSLNMHQFVQLLKCNLSYARMEITILTSSTARTLTIFVGRRFLFFFCSSLMIAVNLLRSFSGHIHRFLITGQLTLSWQVMNFFTKATFVNVKHSRNGNCSMWQRPNAIIGDLLYFEYWNHNRFFARIWIWIWIWIMIILPR